MPTALTLLKILHMEIHKRAVVYAKDVENITGKKKRAAYRLLKKIRRKYNLDNDSFITIDIFCRFTGIKEERVIAAFVP